MQTSMVLVQLFASVCFLAVFVECGPLDFLIQDILNQQDEGTEQHFDQRQTGDENYRVRVNGVVVKVPSPGMSSLGVGLLEGIGSGLLAAASEEDMEEDDDKNQTSWNNPYTFDLASPSKPVQDSEQPSKAIVIESEGPASQIVEDLVEEDNGEGSVKLLEMRPESEVLERRSKIRPKKTPFGLGSLMTLWGKKYD